MKSQITFVFLLAVSFALPVESPSALSSRGGATSSVTSVVTNGCIAALCFYQGNLIAGGDFTQIAGVQANHLALWNGAGWQPLGGGTNGTVNSLLVFDGKLIIGGHFSTAGGQPANNVASWDGYQFGTLGAGSSNRVLALCTYHGLLYAGRDCWSGGQAVDCVVKWNSNNWQICGANFQGHVAAMTVYNDKLIAGGLIGRSSAPKIDNLAYYNDTIWQQLDTTWTAMGVYALAAHNGKLFISASMDDYRYPINGFIWEWDGAEMKPTVEQQTGCFLMGAAGQFLANDSQLLAVGSFAPHDTSHIYSTSVLAWNGSSWHGVLENFGQTSLYDFQGPNFHYLAPIVTGVYLDGQLYIAGLSGTFSAQSSPSDSNGYIGPWIPLESGSGIDDGSHELPVDYSLITNYPNPFNPSTTIAFNLPRPGRVTIAIVNSLGQKVRTVIDQYLPVGPGVVQWDGLTEQHQSASTGMYFAVLKTDEKIETRKMLLIK